MVNGEYVGQLIHDSNSDLFLSDFLQVNNNKKLNLKKKDKHYQLRKL